MTVPGAAEVPGLQDARGKAVGTGVQLACCGRFLGAGVTERITPVKGMLMGSGSRSSHGASRWICSALAQVQQVALLQITRQDSQYHA